MNIINLKFMFLYLIDIINIIEKCITVQSLIWLCKMTNYLSFAIWPITKKSPAETQSTGDLMCKSRIIQTKQRYKLNWHPYAV